MTEIVFRCDASAVLGGGHLVRCQALADTFVERGCRVRFGVSDSTLAALPQLSARYPGSVGGFAADAGDIGRMRQLLRDPADIVVVDSYALGTQFEQAAREHATKLVVIDDAPSRPHVCTHLIDVTYGRESQSYRPCVPDDAVVLCGAKYALLRQAFAHRRPAAPPTPSRRRIPRLLVSLGLSDSANATSRILAGLVPQRASFAVDVVLGALAPHATEVRRLLTEGGSTWRFLGELGADAMAEAMMEADLVIGAPGTASYERCCLGKPSLLVLTADNQADNAAALAGIGAARLVGAADAISPRFLSDAVSELLADPAALTAMAAAAWGVTDGHGCERIADILLG